MNNATQTAVRQTVTSLVRDAMRRSSKDTGDSLNPFRSALIPDHYWRIPRFERSFVTSMGSRGFEELAKIIAEGAGHTAVRGRSTQGRINTQQREYIDTLLRNLRGNRAVPDWENEISALAELQNQGEPIMLKVTSDLYVQMDDGRDLFFSMKTVKPNLDQTERAKRDLLEIIAIDPLHKAYFALPYNPFGDDRALYNWPHPSRIFDMRNDASVLIGRDFWDLLGGSGTYDALVKVFEVVGAELQTDIEDFFSSAPSVRN